MDLGEIRQELDIIDKNIANLYERRMDLCEKVAEYKIKIGKQVLDKEREKQKIEAVAEYVSEMRKEEMQEILQLIMSHSRKLQYKILSEHNMGIKSPFIQVENINKDNAAAVFQGVEGAYSHAAVLQYFGKEVKAFHVRTFEAAMKAINQGDADYAVLPIENSTAGMVGDVYDLLVEYDNYIVGETFVKVEHSLLGLPEAKLEDIKVVYSHNQALMQSSKFLAGYPEWKHVSFENTAASAKKVLDENDKTQAAIASEVAAELYGLKILKTSVNNELNNTTRFIVVSGKKIYTKKANKISICFEIPDESGSLYRILSHIMYNRLSMTKIESRPIAEKNWEYRFFVDFDGNLNNANVRNALKGISEEALFMKILGNY